MPPSIGHGLFFDELPQHPLNQRGRQTPSGGCTGWCTCSAVLGGAAGLMQGPGHLGGPLVASDHRCIVFVLGDPPAGSSPSVQQVWSLR